MLKLLTENFQQTLRVLEAASGPGEVLLRSQDPDFGGATGLRTAHEIPVYPLSNSHFPHSC